jgi:predicted acyltransferase (DUF342 family)
LFTINFFIKKGVDFLNIIAGHLKENITVERDTTITGKVVGDINVLPGASLDLNAEVVGNIYLQKYSQISVRGTISGNIIYHNDTNIELISKVQGELIEYS